MPPGFHFFLGLALGLVIMYFLRAEAVKCARAAESTARQLADDAQDAAENLKGELDKLKNAGSQVVHRVEHAGVAAAQQLHSAPDSH